MDQLRGILATIQKHLRGLTVTQRLLIGSLAVIMLMSLFLVSQYAGSTDMDLLLPGSPAEDQQKAVEFLRTNGVAYKTDATGRPLVRRADQHMVLAQLSQAGKMPTESALVFENILKQQSWMRSKEENRTIFKLMLQNELAAIIGKYRGVSKASVSMDIPEAVGIGQIVRLPRAAVTIWGEGGKGVAQATVDAAARLVAGSVAGMDVRNVVVNDGTLGRPAKVTDEGEMMPTTYRETASAVEEQYKAKIMNMVSYIDPPATVEVTATVDVTRVKAQQTKYLPMSEGSVSPIKREQSRKETENQAGTGGSEPGVRANLGANVATGSGGPGGKREKTDDDTEYDNRVGSRVEQIDDPRGMPTRLVATINVPRAYIAGLVEQSKAAGGAPAAAGGDGKPAGEGAGPTDAEVSARFVAERAAIEEKVKPHVTTRTADGVEVPGQVVVSMVSGEAVAAGGGGGLKPGGTLGGSSGVGGSLLSLDGALGGGWVDKIVLGALALVAMATMFMMVRKATRKTELPTAHELAGLPRKLETKSDLVGEADESETAMAGIEVGESEIKVQKMKEQVSEMIKAQPETASKLLNRWMTVEP